MHAILLTMSQKRLAQCQEDPETLADVIEARHETEIPGLLDLGTAWSQLDAILSDAGKDSVLGDAILARSGEPWDTDFKSARLLAPARVAEIAKKLEGLKAATVLGRHDGDAEEKEALGVLIKQLVSLYSGAAKAKHALLSVIV
jgi:hypothetical protein